LQVPVEQTAPAQQRAPVVPHATHRFVPVSHTNGSPQAPPLPSLDGQHGWPDPPQTTHAPPTQVVDGDVQPTPPLQQDSPSRPHTPF
jgi:hypothetical protein